jgi:hypothetical protein
MAFWAPCRAEPTSALGVLVCLPPELTSLGFLENGSGSDGKLKHLDDVTNIVRRDVSTEAVFLPGQYRGARFLETL